MGYSDNEIRTAVQNRYREKAFGESTATTCCGDAGGTCCGGGYTFDELHTIPAGADLGLGCGNPNVAAAPERGETVLDLGSGAGVDCFLAAQRVGPEGRVIGVDMTEEMVQRAQKNARAGGYTNVEFRLGTIEKLPLEDQTVDLIISNCVINLSPRKDLVFAEAYRVLKPGGRLVVSDLVADQEATPDERANLDLYSACVSGAEPSEIIEKLLDKAGFQDVEIEVADNAFDWGEEDAPTMKVYSATIRAQKGARRS